MVAFLRACSNFSNSLLKYSLIKFTDVGSVFNLPLKRQPKRSESVSRHLFKALLRTTHMVLKMLWKIRIITLNVWIINFCCLFKRYTSLQLILSMPCWNNVMGRFCHRFPFSCYHEVFLFPLFIACFSYLKNLLKRRMWKSLLLLSVLLLLLYFYYYSAFHSGTQRGAHIPLSSYLDLDWGPRLWGQ